MEVSYMDIVAEGKAFGLCWHPEFLGMVYTGDEASGSQFSQVVCVNFPDSGLFHCWKRRSNRTFQSMGFLMGTILVFV